jgi:hypothetical protein
MRRAHCGCVGETQWLIYGTVAATGVATLSVSAAKAGEIVACGARVRPVSQVCGVVRVQILAPNELLVYAQRGAAQVSYRDETETIGEGKAYRVVLNESDDPEQSGSIAKVPAWRRKWRSWP